MPDPNTESTIPTTAPLVEPSPVDKPHRRHGLRTTGSDERWLLGMNFGTGTLALGVAFVVMYHYDSALLYSTRIAAGAVVVTAVAAIVLLMQGVTRKSRRLRRISFWFILLGNLVLIPVLAVCTMRAVLNTPEPPPAPIEGSEGGMVTHPAISESPVT